MTKKLGLIYLACFFLSLHYGALLYVTSSHLSSFFAASTVSSIFFLSATGGAFLFILMPKLLRKLGSKFILLFSIAAAGAGTFGMAFLQEPLFVAISFLIYSILLYVIFYSFDIFLEEASLDNITGEIRGLWIVIMHIGIISGLVSLSVFSGAENLLKPVFVAAGFLLVPTFIIGLGLKSEGTHPLRNHRSLLPLKIWWRMKSVRRITLARLTLDFFYAFMTIYTPLYLSNVMGFSWAAIGAIMAIALIPFVLLQWPAGRLADLFIGEKEMLVAAFLFMIGSLLFMPSLGGSLAAWAGILFLSRVGASLTETLTDSYFFKHVDASDTGLLSIFRLTRPLSVALGALTGGIALNFLSFEYIFYVIAFIVFLGLKEILLLRDTK